MPVALNHPAAAAYRGDVYVLGGYTGRGGLRARSPRCTATTRGATGGHGFRAPPAARRWRWASWARSSTRPAAPTRATGHCAAGDLRLRHPPVDARPRMGFAREHLAGAVAGGAFYVLAGRAAGRGNFKVAERYLPRRGAGSGCRTWRSRAAASAPRRVGGGSSWSEARSSPARSARWRGTTPPAGAGPGCRTCARRAMASGWSPTRARVRDRGRPRTGLLLLPGDRGA